MGCLDLIKIRPDDLMLCEALAGSGSPHLDKVEERLYGSERPDHVDIEDSLELAELPGSCDKSCVRRKTRVRLLRCRWACELMHTLSAEARYRVVVHHATTCTAAAAHCSRVGSM